jgi:endonuclease/exonuclease/phosphatase family metal-dependent hydrolase
VRIATFNILNGAVPGTEGVDVGLFASSVDALDADLLGLQEVDRAQPRSGHADLTEVAADAMGATDHRFVAALAGTPGGVWAAATGEEQPDSAAYGVAFLSRHPVTDWRVVRLPPAPVRLPHRFHGDRWPSLVADEARVGVVADVATPEGPLRVITTHLSFLDVWNGRQLRRLLRDALDPGVPTVLLGDLNMGPARAARISGMRPLAGAATFPADDPSRQLDHLLARGDVSGRDGRSLRLSVSDHRALVAEVSVGATAARG